MSETEKYHRKLTTLKTIQHIIRSLKIMSVIRWRRIYSQLANIENYANTIYKEFNLVMNLQLKNASPSPSKQDQNDVGCVGVIVLTSDKGLCGGFNISMTRFAEDYLKTLEKENKAIKLITLGQYAHHYFSARSYDILYSETISQAYGLTHDKSRDLCEKILSYYEAGIVSELVIVCHQFISFAKTEKKIMKIFPPEIDLMEDISTLEDRYCIDDNLQEIEELLFFEYFASRFYMAINDSLCAEHSARIQAMSMAEDNIQKKEKEIRLHLNMARQEEINEELLDIITGVRAFQK